MDEDKTYLSPLDRKVLESAEKRFPKIAKEVCPDLRKGYCSLIKDKYSFYDCPNLED